MLRLFVNVLFANVNASLHSAFQLFNGPLDFLFSIKKTFRVRIQKNLRIEGYCIRETVKYCPGKNCPFGFKDKQFCVEIKNFEEILAFSAGLIKMLKNEKENR